MLTPASAATWPIFTSPPAFTLDLGPEFRVCGDGAQRPPARSRRCGRRPVRIQLRTKHDDLGEAGTVDLVGVTAWGRHLGAARPELPVGLHVDRERFADRCTVAEYQPGCVVSARTHSWARSPRK